MQKTTKQVIRSLERVINQFSDQPSLRITTFLSEFCKQARTWERSYENKGDATLNFSCDFIDPEQLDCDGEIDPVASFWVSIEIDDTVFDDNVYVNTELMFNYLRDNETDEETWMESKYVKPVIELLEREIRGCFKHKWTVDSSVLASWDH